MRTSLSGLVMLATTTLLAGSCDSATAPRTFQPSVSASVAPGAASIPTPYGVASTGTCGAPSYRAFDFWLGTWDVRDAASTHVGTNRVVQGVGTCAVLEHWVDANGLPGRSLNAYDRRTGSWHQMWVDAGNTTLLLQGGVVREGLMDMRQRRPEGFGGPLRLDIITWERKQKVVQQLWRASYDDGATFQTFFDGTYRRERVSPAPLIGTGTCTNPARPRFFDLHFTLGTWTVRVPAARGHEVLGTATIARDMDGCLHEERFTSRTGHYSSLGFGSFDGSFRRWHREYVDSRGNRLVLTDGGLVGSSMVMTGTVDAGGIPVLYRVTWTPVTVDQFVQSWETSTDGVSYTAYATFVFDR